MGLLPLQGFAGLERYPLDRAVQWRRFVGLALHSHAWVKRSPRMPGSLDRAVFVSRSNERPMPTRSVARFRRWSKVFSKLGMGSGEVLDLGSDMAKTATWVGEQLGV